VERKSWAFQLFSELVASAPLNVVPTLFSRNFIRCTIEHRGNEQKLLYKSVTEALKKIRARAVVDPTLASDMIIGLMGKGKNIFFDKLTKSKTLQDLFALVDGDGLSKLTKMFDSLIIDQSGKELNTASSARQVCSDLLLWAIRGRRKDFFENEAASKCVGKVLEVFIRHAYLLPKDATSTIAPKPELTSESRAMFHARLNSSLNHILSMKLSNPSHWPWFAVHKIHSLTKASKPYQLHLQAEKSILKSLKQYYRTAESIQESLQSSQNGTEQAFALFFELSLLQAYSGDAEAIALLEEIESCYATIKAGDTPAASFDQLVDVLLSLLSKPSTLFKATAEHVFVAIASGISAEGIQSLTDILQKPESLAGRDELFDQEPNDANEDEDSDVEEADASEDSSEDGGDKSSVISNDASDEELARFEESLAAALKTSKPSGAEASGSDDESMDDDQMLALEPHLANIFKERQLLKNKSKEKKNAREVVLNFKRRVLDLLAIYIKQQCANPLSLSVILPLIRLLRTTREKSLETKASEVLKSYYSTCAKTKSAPSPADAEATWSMVKEIHEEVQKNASKVHDAACSRASLFALRCLGAGDGGAAYDRAVDLYTATQRAWFSDLKITVQPTFFTEWISWSIEMRRLRGSSKSAATAESSAVSDA
jgi:DNA polymerase phi